MTCSMVPYNSAPPSQLFSLDLMKPLAPLSFCKEYWEQQCVLNDPLRMQSTESRMWHTAGEGPGFFWQINREGETGKGKSERAGDLRDK